jgi:hypothetical protein
LNVVANSISETLRQSSCDGYRQVKYSVNINAIGFLDWNKIEKKGKERKEKEKGQG